MLEKKVISNIIEEANRIKNSWKPNMADLARYIGALEGILLERGILNPGVPFDFKTTQHSFLGIKYKSKQSYSEFILEKSQELL